MSKNFETEYKALAACEAPDLWSRIEAGLTPKTTEAEEIKTVETGVDTVTLEKAKQKSASKSMIYIFRKYKPALIAAMCVVVILPAAVVISQMGIAGGSKMESAVEYAESATAADTTAEAPTAFETEGTAFAESAETEAADMEEAAMAETINGAAMEEAAADTAVNEMPAEEITEESGAGDVVQETLAETEAAPLESAEEECESMQKQQDYATDRAEPEILRKLEIADGTVLEAVKICINGEVAMKEELYPEAGNFYHIEIIKDKNGVLAEGEEILLFVPEGISELTALYQEKGKCEHEISIEYDSQREYPFYLTPFD